MFQSLNRDRGHPLPKFSDLKEAFNLLNQEMGTHGLLDLGWTAKLDDPKKHFGVCRMGRAAMFVMRLPNSISIRTAGTIEWWVRLEGGTDTTNTRSPSLRDMADADGNLHGGLMHNAIFNSLREVIDHYNAIPNPSAPNLDPRLAGGPGGPVGPGGPGGGTQNLNLTEQEKNDLENFLLTLTGSSVYTDPKWSSPFDGNGSLSLIILPTETATFAISEDAGGNQMVTVSAQGVPNVAYLCVSSPDLSNWSEATEVVADANGLISMTAPVGADKQFFKIGYAVVGP